MDAEAVAVAIDVPKRDRRAAAIISASSAGSTRRSGSPESGPPSADPVSATLDVYCKLVNEDGRFLAGQCVIGSVARGFPRSACGACFRGGIGDTQCVLCLCLAGATPL